MDLFYFKLVTDTTHERNKVFERIAQNSVVSFGSRSSNKILAQYGFVLILNEKFDLN